MQTLSRNEVRGNGGTARKENCELQGVSNKRNVGEQRRSKLACEVEGHDLSGVFGPSVQAA